MTSILRGVVSMRSAVNRAIMREADTRPSYSWPDGGSCVSLVQTLVEELGLSVPDLSRWKGMDEKRAYADVIKRHGSLAGAYRDLLAGEWEEVGEPVSPGDVVALEGRVRGDTGGMYEPEDQRLQLMGVVDPGCRIWVRMKHGLAKAVEYQRIGMILRAK